MKTAQALIIAYREGGGTGGKGSLTARIEAGCLNAELPDGPFSASFFMQARADEGYFPLVSNMDLRGQTVVNVMDFPRC